MKNNTLSLIALSALTFTYGCATAPKTKMTPVPYAVIYHQNTFIARVIASGESDIAVDLYNSLRTLAPKTADELLDEGRTLTGLSEGKIDEVAAKMDPKEKVEFLKKFREESNNAKIFEAIPEAASVSKRIDENLEELAKTGNIEKPSTDITSSISGGAGQTIAPEEKQAVVDMLTHEYSGDKSTPQWEAASLALDTYHNVGVLPLTSGSCKDFSKLALDNVVINQRRANALAKQLVSDIPASKVEAGVVVGDAQKLELRKACFGVEEAQSFVGFVEGTLGGSVDDALALEMDCHQTAKEAEAEIRKVQAKTPTDPHSIGCP